ncbi:MAG: alpha/beta fold hydrolase [Thermoleophilaceae bacterium]
MSGEPTRAGGLVYREAGAPDAPPALLIHGYPASSYMWVPTMEALAAAGYRAIAPDLAGYGDSEPDPPGTWERHTDSIERFRSALEIERAAIVMHDWGVMIGLRWACDHPHAVSALVISDGGFFSDRRWHDLALTLRSEGDGERLIDSMTRDDFRSMLRSASAGISDAALDEYWKCCQGSARRRAQLDLYRSGDFDKLIPYDGRVAELGVPALVLWGGSDRFASVRMAERFHTEIPDAQLSIFDQAGHFVFEDEPAEAARIVAEFLVRVRER